MIDSHNEAFEVKQYLVQAKVRDNNKSEYDDNMMISKGGSTPRGGARVLRSLSIYSMYIYIYVYIYVCVCVYIYTIWVCECVCVCVYISTYLLYMCVCVCIGKRLGAARPVGGG